MENYIGTVLSFNDGAFNNNIRAFNGLRKSINEVGEAYEALDTTFKFTQDVFEDIVAHNTANVQKMYAKTIEKQIETSKFTSKAIVKSMRDNISVEIEALNKKVEAMFNALSVARQSGFYNIYVEFSYIKIVAGKAVLTEESTEILKDLHSETIKTQNQSDFYNQCLEFADRYKDIVSYLNEHHPEAVKHKAVLTENGNSILYVSGEELKINPNYFTAVK